MKINKNNDINNTKCRTQEKIYDNTIITSPGAIKQKKIFNNKSNN
ncbi:hypothetical protein X975_13360, partial [Stegodyphus mimosarum]